MNNVAQGSSEWLKMKLGVISASNVHKAIAKKGTDTREGYISELVGQIATREMPQIDGQALRWGTENEASARSAYELATNFDVEEVAFIYGPDKRTGVSPDGLSNKRTRGLEIKNPWTTKVHIDFLLMDKIKLEYQYQVQFSLFVSGLEIWDFCSYDKRMLSNQLKIMPIERDVKMMERFTNDIGEFILDMDKALDKLGLVYGSQWD